MKNKEKTSKGLRDWFERKGIECPKNSADAIAKFRELSATHKKMFKPHE